MSGWATAWASWGGLHATLGVLELPAAGPACEGLHPSGKQGCTACTFTQRTVQTKLLAFSPLVGELSEEVVARASWSFRANKQQAFAFSSPLNYLPAIGNDDFVKMTTQGSASPLGDP